MTLAVSIEENPKKLEGLQYKAQIFWNCLDSSIKLNLHLTLKMKTLNFQWF